eukprot:SAG31_NODE_227_length_19818_cov_6.503271_17_plen_142_part_00
MASASDVCRQRADHRMFRATFPNHNATPFRRTHPGQRPCSFLSLQPVALRIILSFFCCLFARIQMSNLLRFSFLKAFDVLLQSLVVSACPTAAQNINNKGRGFLPTAVRQRACSHADWLSACKSRFTCSTRRMVASCDQTV